MFQRLRVSAALSVLVLSLFSILAFAQERTSSETKTLTLDLSKDTKLERPKCADAALELLKTKDPAGYRVYTELLAEKMDSHFLFFLSCESGDFGLPSAVHEGVHMLSKSTAKQYSYYLPDGTSQKTKWKNLFYRNEILADLGEGARKLTFYSKTYLEGASGKQDLSLLLDELNAYTQGLSSSEKLAELYTRTEIIDGEKYQMTSQISARDGVAAMLYFTKYYLQRAKNEHAKDWKKIAEDSEMVDAIRILWKNAEKALNTACAIPLLGIEDEQILSWTYEPAKLEALTEILGEEPKLPQGCVKTAPSTAVEM